MKVAHLLRKYNPLEWGGTETALHRLCEGFRYNGVESVVYCPKLPVAVAARDPLVEAGCTVKRFNACVPIWGLPEERKRQMVAVGGNLMSFELIRSLWQEPKLEVIHAHASGRIGAIGRLVARRRGIPFLFTTHGGLYDMPVALQQNLSTATQRGWEWGKLFGMLLKTRTLMFQCDAIVTCNDREAAAVRVRHPAQRVVVQPHGVSAHLYQVDKRTEAEEAFPQIRGREILLSVGRIDPIKNQSFLIGQLPELVRRHPKLLLVLAGASTDQVYSLELERQIDRLGLRQQVLLTGGLPPAHPRLLGLLQSARAVVMQSTSETFGLVILEAWAAGTAVISSRTSGAAGLIERDKTGLLFDLDRPEDFQTGIDRIWSSPGFAAYLAASGRQRVVEAYDTRVLADRMKRLYEELIEEKNALRYSA
jgi:starch synthase